jgi:hypothetical protein
MWTGMPHLSRARPPWRWFLAGAGIDHLPTHERRLQMYIGGGALLIILIILLLIFFL